MRTSWSRWCPRYSSFEASPPAGEVRGAQPKSGCTTGAGRARTVAARRSRWGLHSSRHGRPGARRTPLDAWPPAGEVRGRSVVRMFPRSGPRTDGRCAEGPRVEWFDGEARPTDDPACGAERPDLTTRQQLFPKPSLVVEPARALSGLMARPAPRTTPPAVPNGLPVRPHNNFFQNRLLLLS